MWNLPRPGIEPVSPALASRFFCHWAIREDLEVAFIKNISSPPSLSGSSIPLCCIGQLHKKCCIFPVCFVSGNFGVQLPWTARREKKNLKKKKKALVENSFQDNYPALRRATPTQPVAPSTLSSQPGPCVSFDKSPGVICAAAVPWLWFSPCGFFIPVDN